MLTSTRIQSSDLCERSMRCVGASCKDYSKVWGLQHPPVVRNTPRLWTVIRRKFDSVGTFRGVALIREGNRWIRWHFLRQGNFSLLVSKVKVKLWHASQMKCKLCPKLLISVNEYLNVETINYYFSPFVLWLQAFWYKFQMPLRQMGGSFWCVIKNIGQHGSRSLRKRGHTPCRLTREWQRLEVTGVGRGWLGVLPKNIWIPYALAVDAIYQWPLMVLGLIWFMLSFLSREALQEILIYWNILIRENCNFPSPQVFTVWRGYSLTQSSSKIERGLKVCIN